MKKLLADIDILNLAFAKKQEEIRKIEEAKSICGVLSERAEALYERKLMESDEIQARIDELHGRKNTVEVDVNQNKWTLYFE